MNSACVIGNGTSRLQFSLETIGHKMTTYGCNALYRDYMPDYLISMDYNMVMEIINNKIHYQTNFHTQHDNKIDKLHREGQPIYFFEGYRETCDSGNSALTLALKNGHDVVYMIGFDYSTSPSSLPNVYTGTENYPGYHIYPAASMQDTKWEQRLKKILKNYPNQKIVRVNGTKSLNIGNENYSEITIEQFKGML